MARTAIGREEHLVEQLKEVGVSAAELRPLCVAANGIAAILNGAQSITGDNTQRPAHFFGNSPALRPESAGLARGAAGGSKRGCSNPTPAETPGSPDTHPRSRHERVGL